jgi:hypothetical protein
MNTTRQTKINSLLQKLPSGALYFGSWLNRNGISYFLQRHYRNSQWLTAIDRGVMYRTGETPTLFSALSCFNSQLDKNFHIGAMSALEIRGFAHYIPLGRQTIVVYCPQNEWFPKWFSKYDFGVNMLKKYSEFSETGISTINVNNFETAVSIPERAFLESLDLAPKYYDLTDLFQVMEMLNGLRVNLLQQLLEKCKSIKVKRLFLFMAEKAGHSWLKNLDVSKIDLGKGKRSIVKNGAYNAKYQITISRDLANYE